MEHLKTTGFSYDRELPTGFCELEGKRPKVMESACVHPKATVTRGVTVGEAYYVALGGSAAGGLGRHRHRPGI